MGRRWRSWCCPLEQERRGRGPGGSWWHLGERERRELVVEARWRCGVWAPGASVPCGGGAGAPPFAGPGLIARVGPVKRRGGSWGALRGAAWYWGGGAGSASSMDPPRRGVVAAAAGGMGRVTVLGAVGPGGPLRRGRAGRGDTVPGTGGWLVRGGWPLVVGGVCGWSTQCLPSHSLVLFVHGGLWPGGVGWLAVVVVQVVLVVVVVGLLVVVVLVVVGLVLRVWPLDPLWVFPVPLVGVGGWASCAAPGAALCGGQGGQVGGGA